MADLLPAELLDQARGLTGRARRLVQSLGLGSHRSRSLGGGSEFSEHRAYAPGEDLRHLDWKVFARTDRHVVRRFESDRQLEVLLLLDRSASMGFGTTAGGPEGPAGVPAPEDKWDAARSLALAVAWVFLRQGDRVGLALVDGRGAQTIPTRGGERQLMEMARRTAEHEPQGEADLGAAVTELLGRRRGSLVVLFSDLLADDAQGWLKPLSLHGARGREARVVHVVDPAEISFPYDEPSRFVGLEGGELSLNPREMAEAYRAEFAAFLEAQEARCLDAAVSYHRLVTDQPLEEALPRLLRG